MESSDGENFNIEALSFESTLESLFNVDFVMEDTVADFDLPSDVAMSVRIDNGADIGVHTGGIELMENTDNGSLDSPGAALSFDMDSDSNTGDNFGEHDNLKELAYLQGMDTEDEDVVNEMADKVEKVDTIKPMMETNNMIQEMEQTSENKGKGRADKFVERENIDHSKKSSSETKRESKHEKRVCPVDTLNKGTSGTNPDAATSGTIATLNIEKLKEKRKRNMALAKAPRPPSAKLQTLLKSDKEKVSNDTKKKRQTKHRDTKSEQQKSNVSTTGQHGKESSKPDQRKIDATKHEQRKPAHPNKRKCTEENVSDVSTTGHLAKEGSKPDQSKTDATKHEQSKTAHPKKRKETEEYINDVSTPGQLGKEGSKPGGSKTDSAKYEQSKTAHSKKRKHTEENVNDVSTTGQLGKEGSKPGRSKTDSAKHEQSKTAHPKKRKGTEENVSTTGQLGKEGSKPDQSKTDATKHEQIKTAHPMKSKCTEENVSDVSTTGQLGKGSKPDRNKTDTAKHEQSKTAHPKKKHAEENASDISTPGQLGKDGFKPDQSKTCAAKHEQNKTAHPKKRKRTEENVSDQPPKVHKNDKVKESPKVVKPKPHEIKPDKIVTLKSPSSGTDSVKKDTSIGSKEGAMDNKKSGYSKSVTKEKKEILKKKDELLVVKREVVKKEGESDSSSNTLTESLVEENTEDITKLLENDSKSADVDFSTDNDEFEMSDMKVVDEDDDENDTFDIDSEVVDKTDEIEKSVDETVELNNENGLDEGDDNFDSMKELTDDAGSGIEGDSSDIKDEIDDDDYGKPMTGDEYEMSESDIDMNDDDLHALLEEGMSKEQRGVIGSRYNLKEGEFISREKTLLDEKGTDPFDFLPEDWMSVIHNSGMPIYLHRPTRVVTLTRPYFLGSGSLRRHAIPISAIPCLQYRRELDKEKAKEDAANTTLTNGDVHDGEQTGVLDPEPKPEMIKSEEVAKLLYVEPDDVQTYCKKLFQFKNVAIKKFRTWREKRAHIVHEKKMKNVARMGSDTKLITCAIPPDNTNSHVTKTKKKEFILNPEGKTPVCILHEYAQNVLRSQPTYVFKEIENAETPFKATIYINNLQYGTGVASGKRQAKNEAAKRTLEVFMPFLSEQWQDSAVKSKAKQEQEAGLKFFEEISIEDPRVTELCDKASLNKPFSILQDCLDRNFGLGDTKLHSEKKMISNQKTEYILAVGKHKTSVICKNKREAKQRAAQAMLQKLHPNLHNWAAILRLYNMPASANFTETTIEQVINDKQKNMEILTSLKTAMLEMKERRDKMKDNKVTANTATLNL